MRRLFLPLLFVLVSLNASASTLQVGAVAGECGKSVIVPVSVDQAAGMLAIEFRISFDSAKVTFETATSTGVTSGFSLASNVAGSTLTVAMASGTAVSGSGPIANLTFRVGAGVAGNVPLTLSNGAINDVSTVGTSGQVSATCGGTSPCTACVPSSGVACMLDGRFAVTMTWINRFQTPALSGSGRLIQYVENRPATDSRYGATSEVTYFSMYSWVPTSVEAIVRIINGVGINDRFWIYMTGFSNAEYTVNVVDTKTCRTWTRTNPHGSFGIITDQSAFPLQ